MWSRVSSCVGLSKIPAAMEIWSSPRLRKNRASRIWHSHRVVLYRKCGTSGWNLRLLLSTQSYRWEQQRRLGRGRGICGTGCSGTSSSDGLRLLCGRQQLRRHRSQSFPLGFVAHLVSFFLFVCELTLACGLAFACGFALSRGLAFAYGLTLACWFVAASLLESSRVVRQGFTSALCAA